jgi:predicted SnoaL-like aldol condensation-catalyzing enzyme
MSLDANKATVRRFYDACMNDGDPEAVPAVIAPEFTDHSYALRGVEAVQQFVRTSRANWPELRFTIDEIIAEGDIVAVRWTGTGRHAGGKQATWTGMGFYRLRDGRITDHWANVDQLSLQRQLGG